MRKLEIIVTFQHLGLPDPDWFENAAYLAKLRRDDLMRARGRSWYSRRKNDLAWKRMRNAQARENTAKRLHQNASLEREKQKEHRQKWRAKLKADPKRYAEYLRKQNNRRKRRKLKISSSWLVIEGQVTRMKTAAS